MPRSRSRSPHRDVRRRSRSRDRGDRGDRDRERQHRHRSRSRSPRRRSPRRDRERESQRERHRSVSPKQSRDRREKDKHESQSSRPIRHNNTPKISDQELEGMTEEEQQMAKLMGFAAFDTTKNKKVEGNEVYTAYLPKKRRYRQYMNRRGGFNRPLDFIA